MKRFVLLTVSALALSSLLASCDGFSNKTDSLPPEPIDTVFATNDTMPAVAAIDYGDRTEAMQYLENFYKRYIPMCVGNNWIDTVFHNALTPELDRHITELMNSHTLDWDPLLNGQEVPSSLQRMNFSITVSNDRGWYSMNYDDEQILVQVVKTDKGYRINDIAISSGGTVMTMQKE